MTSQATTIKHLKKIMQLCNKAGVKTYQQGDLRLEFHEQMPQTVTTGYVRMPRGMAKTDHEKESEDARVQDELRVKEDQLAMLMIENPEEFERQIAAGDLEEVEEPESDEDE
jgi:hypothetical protein